MCDEVDFEIEIQKSLNWSNYHCIYYHIYNDSGEKIFIESVDYAYPINAEVIESNVNIVEKLQKALLNKELDYGSSERFYICIKTISKGKLTFRPELKFRINGKNCSRSMVKSIESETQEEQIIFRWNAQPNNQEQGGAILLSYAIKNESRKSVKLEKIKDALPEGLDVLHPPPYPVKSGDIHFGKKYLPPNEFITFPMAIKASKNGYYELQPKLEYSSNDEKITVEGEALMLTVIPPIPAQSLGFDEKSTSIETRFSVDKTILRKGEEIEVELFIVNTGKKEVYIKHMQIEYGEYLAPLFDRKHTKGHELKRNKMILKVDRKLKPKKVHKIRFKLVARNPGEAVIRSKVNYDTGNIQIGDNIVFKILD